jgi:hypothetical protein
VRKKTPGGFYRSTWTGNQPRHCTPPPEPYVSPNLAQPSRVEHGAWTLGGCDETSWTSGTTHTPSLERLLSHHRPTSVVCSPSLVQPRPLQHERPAHTGVPTFARCCTFLLNTATLPVCVGGWVCLYVQGSERPHRKCSPALPRTPVALAPSATSLPRRMSTCSGGSSRRATHTDGPLPPHRRRRRRPALQRRPRRGEAVDRRCIRWGPCGRRHLHRRRVAVRRPTPSA